MRSKAKLVLMFLTVITVSAVFASPAFASTTLSSGKTPYGPFSGISYTNYALVSNNAIITGAVSVNGNKTIPAGYSGGQASTYRNGALCTSQSLYYEESPETGWTTPAIHKNCGTGNYTTRGSTAAYDGNAYQYYYTKTTPILQYS